MPDVLTSAAAPDTHEMVVIHRAFRRESQLLGELITAVPAGDTSRAHVLCRHLARTGRRWAATSSPPLPRAQLLVFLGAVLEEETVDERAALLGAMPLVARLPSGASGDAATPRTFAGFESTPAPKAARNPPRTSRRCNHVVLRARARLPVLPDPGSPRHRPARRNPPGQPGRVHLQRRGRHLRHPRLPPLDQPRVPQHRPERPEPPSSSTTSPRSTRGGCAASRSAARPRPSPRPGKTRTASTTPSSASIPNASSASGSTSPTRNPTP